MKRDSAWLVALALGLVAVTPSPAWAYVDPGTGSYLFQLAAAGFLAGLFTIRRYWGALKARFGGRPAAGSGFERPPDSNE